MRSRFAALVIPLGLFSLLISSCAPAALPPAATPAAVSKAKESLPTTSKPGPTQAPPAPTPKPEKVVLTIPTAGFSDFFTLVADKKGFWREEGFDVDKQVVKADIALKVLVGGETEYSRVIGSAIRAAATGVPVKGILAAQTRPPQVLVSRAEIKTVADLKGKTVGIGSTQSTTHVLAQAIMKNAGMDPEKDVVYVSLLDDALRLQAVQAGTVQASMLDVAYAVKAEGMGLKMLVNAADITERIMGGLATTDKRIKENPDQVLRFVRAHVKALKYIRDSKNKDELIQLMVNEFQISKDEAARTYEMGVKGFSADGDISEEAVKLEIEDAKLAAGVTKEVPVSQVFDYSFVKRLKQ